MTDPDEILSTQRLILRYMRRCDVDPLVELWTDPAVTGFLGGPREKTALTAGLEDAARNPRAEPYDLWPLVEKSSGAVVGHCGLLEKAVEGRTEIEVVFVLAESAQGKGYATEAASALRDWAFTRRGLTRLIALIEPGNAASERVARKIGMRLEREIVRPGGSVRRLYALERGREQTGRTELIREKPAGVS
jgi:ribosomal-protein-alanine N-acetyltransferase